MYSEAGHLAELSCQAVVSKLVSFSSTQSHHKGFDVEVDALGHTYQESRLMSRCTVHTAADLLQIAPAT